MASERKLQINFLYGRFHTGAFYPVVEPATSMWRGTGGREPGRTGGGRGTGDERRKGGGGISTMAEAGEKFKRQAFVFCYCLLPVKEKLSKFSVRTTKRRLQNSRFFFRKSVRKSVKRGVRVLHARSARASHARMFYFYFIFILLTS